MTKRQFLLLYHSVSRGYAFRELEGGVGVYRLPLFEAIPEIDHGFSARTGGVSTGDFASLTAPVRRTCDKRSCRNVDHRACGLHGILLL